MKATRSQQRIFDVLVRARAIRRRDGLTYEWIRDDLNTNYLHRDDHVTAGAVTRWFQETGEPVNCYAEYALALREWVQAHE